MARSMWCANKYNDLEMLVLDGTFVEIYFYDFYTMKKTTLRNNTSVWRVLYLIFVKYILMRSTEVYTHLNNMFTPLMMSATPGVFEVVHYVNREKQRYYTKADLLDKDLVLHYMRKQAHTKFLYATISDKYNVTDFVNNHITSFHSKNSITVLDLILILMINKHQIPTIGMVDEYYLKVIDDAVLDETIFKDRSSVILTRDE